MSSEIRVSASIEFVKGLLSNAFALAAKQFDMTGTAYERRSFSVPTSATAIPLGDITTPGWFFIYNTDPTNYVEIYTASGGVTALKLKPGEFAIGRFSVAAPAARANTAAVVIDYLLLQD